MRAALVFAAGLAGALAAVPVFPQEWYSFLVSDLTQNQGNYALPNGDLCCADGAMDCQIQVQTQAADTYVSLSRNATTQVFGSDAQPYAIVTLYNLNKEIAVDANFNCQEFCPNGHEVMSALARPQLPVLTMRWGRQQWGRRRRRQRQAVLAAECQLQRR